MSKRKMIIGAGILAIALLIAAPVMSVRWDGYFTNLLVKGLFQPQGKAIMPTTALSGTSPVGFSIANTADGILFTVDPTTYPSAGDGLKQNGTDECPIGILNTGVTVTVEPSTAATGDRVIGIQNVGGTTAFVVQLTGSLPIQNASGTTVTWTTADAGAFDAAGDIVWLRLPYNGAVSAYVINRDVQ